jgi:hypothetical protein
MNMKITNEMVERFRYEARDREGKLAPKSWARRVLAATLEEVPEPCDLESAAHWHREYTKLESKLAKVRSWGTWLAPSQIVELSNILDGE